MIIKKRNRSGILEYYKSEQPKRDSKIKSRLEKFEQIDLNSHCEIKWHNAYDMMWHTVNESGANGSSHYGSQLNKMGRKTGVPDWLVMVPAHGNHGLYVEVKREYKKDSSTSKQQKDFLLRAESLGYKAAIGYGFECCLEIISDYFNNSID